MSHGSCAVQYYDKSAVSPATLTIFNNYTRSNGTSLSQTINLDATAQHYRYRVFEFTVLHRGDGC